MPCQPERIWRALELAEVLRQDECARYILLDFRDPRLFLAARARGFSAAFVMTHDRVTHIGLDGSQRHRPVASVIAHAQVMDVRLGAGLGDVARTLVELARVRWPGLAITPRTADAMDRLEVGFSGTIRYHPNRKRVLPLLEAEERDRGHT